MTYASGDGSGSTAGQQAHAAVAVECMDCHDLNYMFGRPPHPPSNHHKIHNIKHNHQDKILVEVPLPDAVGEDHQMVQETVMHNHDNKTTLQ